MMTWVLANMKMLKAGSTHFKGYQLNPLIFGAKAVFDIGERLNHSPWGLEWLPFQIEGSQQRCLWHWKHPGCLPREVFKACWRDLLCCCCWPCLFLTICVILCRFCVDHCSCQHNGCQAPVVLIFHRWFLREQEAAASVRKALLYLFMMLL